MWKKRRWSKVKLAKIYHKKKNSRKLKKLKILLKMS